MMNRNLRYTSFVTTTFEVGVEEGREDSSRLLFADEACWYGEDVGIIMLACQLGQLDIPADTFGYLFITIEIPLPEPQTEIPRWSSPDSMACPIGCA